MKRNLQVIITAAALVVFACGKNEKEWLEPSVTSSDFIQTDDADEEVESATNPGVAAESILGINPISAARKYAEQLLHRASQSVESSSARRLFQTMQGALAHATIRVARKGKSFKECVTNLSVLAFVMSNRPNIIHVCPRAAGADPKSLAQVLIHETAHVVGVHDECQATKVEVTAMRRSGANLAFKNGYMNRCGIK